MMQRGFSLVELSIVLVILGLLTGGILAGQSLIRASELRTVTTQFNSYLAATQTFRDKYFNLPGDFTKATSFWGDQAAGTDACADGAIANGTPGTCNGNGNGQVEFGPEAFRYWQHLAMAGMAEGSYTGYRADVFPMSASSANSPTGKIGTSLWLIYHVGTTSGHANYFDGQYGNVYQFGGFVANGDNYNPVLKPEEAWNIDTKIDDGKPAIGKLVMREAVGGWGSCTNAAGPTTLSADYNLTSTSTACTPTFRQLF